MAGSHLYARISVNVPLVEGVFDYSIPLPLCERLSAGCLVEVPFGNRTVQGVVLEFPDKPGVAEVKPVLDLVDPTPVVTVQQLNLAEWLHRHSTATLSQCVQLMVFPGLREFADVRYTLQSTPSGVLPARQQQLLNLFAENKTLRGKQLDRALRQADWRSSARALATKGILAAENFLPRPSLHPRLIKMVQLACPLDQLDYSKPPFISSSPARTQSRVALMKFLSVHPDPLDLKWVQAEVGYDVNASDLAALTAADMISVWESEVVRDPLQKISPDVYARHDLTPTQAAGWECIQREMDSDAPDPLLLFGVTGSGKTELYLLAAEKALARGQQVLWLVPEISLTPQTVGRLMHRFPGKVGLVHSRLSEGERYDTWQRARAGKIPLIAGPRSALFTPLQNLGLIVIDEAHDSSYYSSDETPSYNAVELALAYARECGAACILGTATPDVALHYQAQQFHWPVVELPDRAGFARGNERPSLPTVQVVDMRVELRQGNRSIFSRALSNELYDTFQSGKQSILFLNRRGSSTHVFCRECGTVLECPRCSLPLTAHSGDKQLLCHQCGYSRMMPERCPECKSQSIRHIGIGTEAVEREVRRLLPQARVLRWDMDSRREMKLSEMAMTHFKNHQYDILVGTQMISKGLDFPQVSLVGMVLADIGLNLPDYRSPERVFQVMTQVAGRAGRTGYGGRVLLQTYQPEHYAIQAAAKQSFSQFYRQEIDNRRSLGYPPFGRIVRIEDRDRDEPACRRRMEELAVEIRGWLDQAGAIQTELLGPLPCFFARVNEQYRWQIVLRGPDPIQILRLHAEGLATFRVEADPPNLL